ncbi:MAG: recombinase RecT [Pyramidobacter sp.]|nr:recombinase RecT [Pyramidobacter sp.]
MSSSSSSNGALASRFDSRGSAPVKKSMQDVLKKMLPQIAMALPVHLKNNAERYGRQLLTLYGTNPMLSQCSVTSQLGALMTAAALGLEMTPQLGQCYLIPRRVKGQYVANFQMGYKGMLALAMRSGQIRRIFAEVVHEKDFFAYSMGLDERLEHRPSEEEDRGPVTHVYALAKLTNGGVAFDVWPVARVTAHAKRFSQAYGSGPWATDWEAMAKKTVLMSIMKYLPITTDLQQAAAADGTARDVSYMALSPDVRDERAALDLPVIQMEESEEDLPAAEAESPADSDAAEEKVLAKSYRTGVSVRKESDQSELNIPMEGDENPSEV